MADPHFLYLVLALDAVGLVAWVLYVLVRLPPARPAAVAVATREGTSSDSKPLESTPGAPSADSGRRKLPSHSDIQDDPADSSSE